MSLRDSQRLSTGSTRVALVHVREPNYCIEPDRCMCQSRMRVFRNDLCVPSVSCRAACRSEALETWNLRIGRGAQETGALPLRSAGDGRLAAPKRRRRAACRSPAQETCSLRRVCGGARSQTNKEEAEWRVQPGKKRRGVTLFPGLGTSLHARRKKWDNAGPDQNLRFSDSWSLG